MRRGDRAGLIVDTIVVCISVVYENVERIVHVVRPEVGRAAAEYDEPPVTGDGMVRVEKVTRIVALDTVRIDAHPHRCFVFQVTDEHVRFEIRVAGHEIVGQAVERDIPTVRRNGRLVAAVIGRIALRADTRPNRRPLQSVADEHVVEHVRIHAGEIRRRAVERDVTAIGRD